MFEGLGSVTLLDLTDNDITLIEENALSPLVNSKIEIILDKNLLTHLDGNMLKGGKKGTLRLHNVPNFGAKVESPSNTFNTSQYGTVDFYKCGITALRTNGMFVGAFTVQTLNMVECKINTIESFALKDMINLKYLNLERNLITSVGTNSSSFAGLIRLLEVNLNSNKFTEFAGFINSYQSITKMELNANKFYAIKEGQFAAYIALTVLMLEGNPFINITTGNWIGQNNQVQEMSITFPPATLVPDNFFLYLVNLKTVILNEATVIPFNLTSFPNAEVFALKKFRGGPGQLSPEYLTDNSGNNTGHITITTLLIDGGNSQLQYIPDETLSLFTALKNLTAVKCRMTSFPNLSTIAETIEYVDLNKNELAFDTLTLDKLRGLSRLKVLKLDDCGMKDFLWEGMPHVPNLKEFYFDSMEVLRNFTEYIRPPLVLDEFDVAGTSYNCTVGMCWVKTFDSEGFYPSNPNIGLRSRIFPNYVSPCSAMIFPHPEQKSRYHAKTWGSIAKECMCSGYTSFCLNICFLSLCRSLLKTVRENSGLHL